MGAQRGIADAFVLGWRGVVLRTALRLGLVFAQVLIRNYGAEMRSAAPRLCTMLCEYFVRTAADAGGDDPGDDAEVNQALAAAASLQALAALLVALKGQDMYQALEQDVVTLLQHLLTPQREDYWDETVELLETLVRCSPSVSVGLWAAFGALLSYLQHYGLDGVAQCLPCLDLYLARDPNGFLQGVCPVKREKYSDMFLRLLSTVANDPDLRATYHVVPRALDSALQYCKPCPGIEAFLPQCYDVLWVLQPHAQPPGALRAQDLGLGFRVLWFNAVACGLFCNTSAALQWLHHRGLLGPILTQWADLVPQYTRHYDAKLNAIALVCVLQSSIWHGQWFPPEAVALVTSAVVSLVAQCPALAAEAAEAYDADGDEEEEDEDEDEGRDWDGSEDWDAAEDGDEDEEWEEDEEWSGEAVCIPDGDSRPQTIDQPPTAPQGIQQRQLDQAISLARALGAELPNEARDCPVLHISESALLRDCLAQVLCVRACVCGALLVRVRGRCMRADVARAQVRVWGASVLKACTRAGNGAARRVRGLPLEGGM